MFLCMMTIIALRLSLFPRSLALVLTKQSSQKLSLHRCIHTPRRTAGTTRTSASSLFKDFDDPFLITNQSNDKVKLVQSLLQSNKKKRRKSATDSDLVVVEGVRAIHDALDSGMIAKFVLHTPIAGHSPVFPGENEENREQTTAANADENHREVDEDLLLASESLPQRGLRDDLIKKLYEPEMIRRVFRIEDRVYREISDTMHGQGFLAVMDKPISTVSSFYSNGPGNKSNAADLPHSSLLLLALDRIADPGNLGTLLRSAYGLGVSGVLAIDCCDAFSAKCTRSAMAMNLRLPILQLRSEEVLGAIRDLITHSSTFSPSQHISGYQLVVADGSTDSIPYHTVDYGKIVQEQRKALILMIGSEAHGVSPNLHGLRTVKEEKLNGGKDSNVLKVRIPMVRSVDSFNAAVAGSIILADIQRKLCK